MNRPCSQSWTPKVVQMLNPSSRKFEFVTFNGQPSKAASDASRRRLVRKNAKRYSLEAHALPIDSQRERPGNISAYTGRFHLEVVPREVNEEVARGKAFRKRDEYKLGRSPDADNDQVEKVVARRLAHERPLSRSLDTGKIDPFGTLSIKIGVQEEVLFQHVNAAFELPSYVFNAGASLFRLVSTDPAWFHATLSLIALHHDLSAGQKVSRLSLYHRGEALRLVQWRLQDGEESLDDATIGAVASMVNFDTVIGDYANATAHARGLTVMLSAKGGLKSFEYNEVLQKVVGWSDLTYSAAWKQKPRYPVIYTQYCDGTIEHILTLKPRFPSGTFRRIRGLDDDLNDLLEALQALTALVESPRDMENHERDLMRGIYIVEHVLLGLLEDCSSSRMVVVIAFGLYLYLGLRQMPRTSAILGRMVTRLRSGLEESMNAPDILEPSLLFWISSLGVVAGTDHNDGGFFQRMVDKLRSTLAVQNAEDRKEVLMSVVWMSRISD